MTFYSNFDFVFTIMGFGKLMETRYDSGSEEVLHYTLIFTYLERGVSLDSIKIKTRIEYLKVTKRAMSNGLAENMGLVGSRCWMEL